MILSVSENAINQQLRVLYAESVDPGKRPVQTQVTGGGMMAPTNHQINHNLSIHGNNEALKYDR